MTDPALEVFQEQRPMLFGIAYRMLGSVTDAEDILQDAWLKWSSAYVGPWLPEPMVTADDTEGQVEQAEAVSLAMVVVLETLSPLERAVFVLKEVFGFSFGEIAEILGRGEASVRQVGSRARSHVRARRPRYQAPADIRRRVTDEFLGACLGGDLNQMMELLAPEVAAWTDGGGKVRAALRPLFGAENVAHWILGVLRRPPPDVRIRQVLVNGEPGLLITSAGIPDSVIVVDLTEDSRIDAIRLIRNPDKLRGVGLGLLAPAGG